jgi:transposase
MGLDQHRAQITADWLDTETGEVSRTRVSPADRAGVRRFLERFCGRELEVALEATTAGALSSKSCGAWARRYVWPNRRRRRLGVRTTSARRNDRADARHLRELVMVGRLPESWIPPEHLLDLRARVRLRHSLVAQRGEWQQRIQAVLYHHGFPQRRNLMTEQGRQWLARQKLPATAREQITVAIAMVDALDGQLAPIDKQLRSDARRQPGCRALMGQFGIGEMTAVTILAELGDARRFSCSRDAVRYAGLDVTVHQSDRRRAPGHLSRQGPPALRGALFEAALCASRSASPDHDYYRATAERLGGTGAGLALARKLLKRSYHTLRELGEEALAPA